MELLKSIATFYLTYLSPVLDILLLAFLMYKSYQILVKTQAMQLGKGALIMGGIYAVALAHCCYRRCHRGSHYFSTRIAENVFNNGTKRLAAQRRPLISQPH